MKQIPVKLIITLPNGRACSIGVYTKAWKTLLRANPTEQIKGWDHFPIDAASVLAQIRRGLHDRINRHDRTMLRNTRKWNSNWEREMRTVSRQLNTPRLAIHWLPLELRARFAEKIS